MTGDWLEVSGADEDEALNEAVKLLGVAGDDLESEALPADEGVRLRVRARPEFDTADDTEADEDDEHADDRDVPSGRGPRGERRYIEVDPEVLREQKDTVLDFLVDLLEAFDLEGEIVGEYRDGVLHVDINGDDLGSLIGRRGATMAALAEITKTVVQRRTAARVRLHLDVQGYRAKRRVALERYATQLAQDVARSGVEKALEPMSASERKVVHDSVLKVDGVRSYSEGSEPRRNVVISPT